MSSQPGMSSSIRELLSPSFVWQHERDDIPNNGESSRQAQLRLSKRQLSSSPRRDVKRRREDTPCEEDEGVRSTSNEEVDQNASGLQSLGGTTETGVEEEFSDGFSREPEPRPRKRERMEEDNDDEEGEDGDLYSERTQPLIEPDEDEDEGEGEEEDEEDFLPEEDDELRQPTDLDNPISLEDDFFRPIIDEQEEEGEGGEEGEEEEDGVEEEDEEEEEEEEEEIPLANRHTARASDYLPRPIAAIPPSTSRSPVAEINHFEPHIAPRLPTAKMDRMSQVLEQSITITYDEYDEEYEQEYSSGSYHSGDSDEYVMDQRPILERTAVKKDIKDLMDGLPAEVSDQYAVVDRLGEGTFSSVYLAHDNHHQYYDNGYWHHTDEEEEDRPPVKVALKKILATSSPVRIQNELQLLESLRGCRNVSQLITAFRYEDQVIIVLPYHQSDDFRHFYRHMDATRIRYYMLTLLQALKDTHRRGIVHRDVKPANFLFDYESCTGVLCDFGLAERYTPPRKACCQHEPATLDSLHGKRVTKADKVVEQACYLARTRGRAGEGRVGFLQDDKRGSVKTNRAGTRGFRAPEVLLKCPDQTVGIDVWSAGMMLLSILTHKFPVFNSNDDIEALMEIAAVFGRQAMEKCAALHNRTIVCNLPTLETNPDSIKSLILKLNPHIFTPPVTHPTSVEARAHIEAMDQAIDLCTRLLKLDVTKRPTAAESLRHKLFTGLIEREDMKITEALSAKQGRCGSLHGFNSVGRHRALIGMSAVDMHFGMGIPVSVNEFCPEHQHFEQRTGLDPLQFRQHHHQSRQPILEPVQQSSPATTDASSTNSSPEKDIPPAIPLPRLSQNSQPLQTKREALGTVDMNRKRAPAQQSLGAVASATGVPVKQVLGLGLGRFTRDAEDVAIREGARRKMF